MAKKSNNKSSELIGKKAPAFSLQNQDDEKVALKDFIGRWIVLYFYPKDNTPGCTTEACGFTEALPDFKKLDAVILGVSPDSPASHRRFIEKQDLKITLLSDPDHKIAEQYGAWGIKKLYGREFEGIIRSTILIDPKGKIAWHWPKVKVAGHVEAVREKIEEIK